MTKIDFKEEKVKREIERRGAKRVLIQLPEGLKREGPRLGAIVEKAGAVPFVSADSCYGACDLATLDAESLGVDLIVHYGHSEMMKQERVQTLFVEARATISIKSSVKKAIRLLKNYSNIGLVATIQHTHMLNKARELLLKGGKTVAIGDAGQSKYAGQVIGCDFSNARLISKDVEAFLFLGGGRFHAIGVELVTGKPTIVADPYERRAYPVRDEVVRVLKERWASICKAKEAKAFGVLIGLKTGQKRVRDALRMKRKLEKNGRKATLLSIREITPNVLMQFLGINAYVNTACPRISLDDTLSFRKPVLTYNETLVMLGRKSWEELCRKGWFGS
ncbi:MAG: diphthamide biosynthesis enzyme Dph2 [Candidatus Bathyarchaeota archaeon]|nr:MAG: diphthamide biosynthesis enzyme Dph2 [Candidatus Bathyarchaeota archaeon]